MNSSKRITARILSTVLAIMMLFSLVTVGFSASAAQVEIVETGATITGGQTFYLNAQSWGYSDARYAMYLCNGTSAATWVDMTLVDGTTYMFQATTPAGQSHANIIFVRMNGAKPANDWANKWNQTGDLTWNGTSNCFKPSGWDGSTTTWSTYTPPVVSVQPGDASTCNLMGDTLPGGNWTTGLNMVYAEDTKVVTYSFKDLAAGSYSFKVKNGDAWKAPTTTVSPAEGGTIGTDADGNIQLTAIGGDYTFNYTIASNTMTIVYTPPVVEAPAAPAAATVAVNGNLGGTGTEEDPYLVAPEAAITMTISGVKGEATGLAYNVDNTESQVKFSDGAASVIYTGATAPAVDTAKAINVYLWAYNAIGSATTYSETYATTTVYVKGYEAAVDPEAPVVDNALELPYEKADGLYAYAGTEVLGTNAWQRWHEYDSVRHFFLPATASASEVVILNTYSTDVTLNGITIPAGEYATVPYVDGVMATCSGATTQSVVIAKSDAEGTLFVNSKDGMVTVNDDAAKTETEVDATYDLYAFLTGNTKNRAAEGTAGAVASEENGVLEDTTVKKIKGRGNTTWSETKKPFNITYKDNIEIDGMKGKKWSLLANAKDGSLLHNRLVYDMANEIGMVYACDSRFVDFFVNGYYKGSYQLTQKIEMGKNTVMSDLEEPEVEDVTEDDGTVTPYPTENFDFILELDTRENAATANDKGYETPEGQWMTYKTPDSPATEQEAFIQAKYNELEDALYGDDMAALEEILDLGDFARAYLINEVSKNIDAGVTSCYFVYDSANDIFRASPVWDYDNAVGNLPDNGARTDMNGNTLDLDGPTGWYARDLKHYARNARNVFGQAWYNTSKTSDGKSFEDIVKEVWTAEFADIVDILNGDATANGRLKSYEAYMANLTKTGTFNLKADGAYVTADWKANKTSLVMYNYDADTNTLTTTNKTYPATFVGETEYSTDWTISRINWLAAQFSDAETVVPDGYITVYFENNWKWADPTAYYWGSTIGSNPAWPGVTLTNVVDQNSDGYDIYEVVIPADITGLIFAGGGEQSVDITSGWAEGLCYYMQWDDATQSKQALTYEYKVPTEPDEPVITPDEPVDTPDEPVITPDEPVDPEYTTIYVENNWNWADGSIYFWGSETAENPQWPGIAYTTLESAGQNTDGVDIYKVELPADATGFLLVGTGSFGEDKSADVTEWAEGDCFYMIYDDATATKLAQSHPYSDHTETPVETPDEPVITPDEPVITPDEPVVPEYTTIYVENNWNWADGSIYFWGSETAENPEWPGIAYTTLESAGENSDGVAIYKVELPADATGFLLVGTGSFGEDKSADVTEWAEGDCFYMIYDEATATKLAQSHPYSDHTETPVETPDEPVITPDEPVDTPDEPIMPTVVTVYAINSANWTEVFAYCWDGNGADNTWPGVAMEKTEETVNGFDVYTLSFDSSFVNVIFNQNGDSAKTADLTVMDGQYYDIKGGVWYESLDDVPGVDPLATDDYIAGSFTNWGTGKVEFKYAAAGDTTATLEFELEAATDYEFKIIRDGSIWTSCKTTLAITESVSGLVFSSSISDNTKLTTTVAGTYKFIWDEANSKLAVVYPGDEIPDEPTPDEPIVDTTVKLMGTLTDWSDGLEMTLVEGSTTVYTAEVKLAANTYELKIKEFGTWLGNTGTINDTAEGWTFKNKDAEGNDVGNCTLKATGGTYTFIFDSETDKLTVTAVLDEIPVETPDEPTVETFTVIFLNGDGTYLGFAKVEAGQPANIPPAIPEMEGDAQYTYTFAGWDKDFSAVTEDMIVTALYDKTVNEYTVKFVDYNGTEIDSQTVAYGAAAVAPANPSRDGYTFKGWDTKFDVVTGDITVTAQYTKIVEAATTGTLRIEVAGGAGFSIALNGGNARPQGTSYMNTKAPINASVTVTAKAADNFLGWMNSAGLILTTDLSYTFVTTGDDYLKAMYQTDIEEAALVIFKNDKANQIIDMQYYVAGDEIVFPALPGNATYEATGWAMSAEEIAAKVAAGESVTVAPTWVRKIVYVNITVVGGTSTGITNGQAIRLNAVTVTADAAPAGQKFAYWADQNGKALSYNAEYKFYPANDMTVTAVYVAEDATIDYDIILGINMDTSNESPDTNTVILSWEVPAGADVTFVQAGSLLVDAAKYNEATFIKGTSDTNVTKWTPAASNQKTSNVVTVNKKGVANGSTWVLRAWLTYTDATGTHTIYSDLVYVDKL